MKAPQESFKRTVFRTLSWHLLGVAMLVVGGLWSGVSLWAAFVGAVGYHAIRFLTHVPHDRIWTRIRGRWIDREGSWSRKV